jgi:hypothetical protein
MNDDLYNAILDELAACHHDDDLSITYLPEREQIAERIMKRIEPMIDELEAKAEEIKNS